MKRKVNVLILGFFLLASCTSSAEEVADTTTTEAAPETTTTTEAAPETTTTTEAAPETTTTTTSTTTTSTTTTSTTTTSTTLAPVTTTTTTTSTTTTTLPPTTGQDVGYQGYVSPESGNLTSILRSATEGGDFCSSSTFFAQPAGVGANVGLPDIYNLYPTEVIASTATTQLTENSTNTFEVTVTGNGDANYKYYFIEPFTATYKEIVPSSVVVNSGSTVASFNKDGLTNGYWFYGYADNGTGGIALAYGLREFLVGSLISQDDIALGSIEKVWLHTSSESVINGTWVNAGETVYLTYLLTTGYNDRSTLWVETDVADPKLDATTTTVKLNSGQFTQPGDVLLVHDELMLIKSKIGPATLSVERGYLNTVATSHNNGTAVKGLVTSTDTSAVNGYAVFKGESGYRFTVSLGREGVPSPFLLTSDCPNDLYSLDYIKVFGWREKGSSLVTTLDLAGGDSLVSNDTFTLVGGNASYTAPTITSVDATTGAHLNTGPKSVTYAAGDNIEFDFAGITKGSRDVTFVEMEFEMSPLTTWLRGYTTRKVILTPNNGSFKYSQNIGSLSTTAAFAGDTWEKGYKYTLLSVTINDGISKLKYMTNGVLKNLTTGVDSTHSVYYLDQYIFSIDN